MNTPTTNNRLLLQMRSIWLLIFLAVGIFLVDGCGKKSSPNSKTAIGQNNPASDQIPASDSGSAVGNVRRVVPVTIVDSTDASAQLTQLNQLIRRFSMERREAPKSLNDLVAAGYLAGLPTAPSGKQFVIDAKSLQVLLK
jgi:hypothetical protein